MSVTCSLGAILYGLSTAGPLPFAFSLAIGMGEVMCRVTAATVLQTATPRALLGRVFGAFEAILILSMALGALTAGPVLSLLGGRMANLCFALAVLVALSLAVPLVARLDATLGIRLFLRHVPILRPLSFQVLDDLVSSMQLERFSDGQTIIREGEPGDRFYLVKAGEVELRAKDGRDQERHLARMGRADYFGELALLRDEPRTATVTALGAVELYALCRTDFQSLLQHSDAFRTSLISGGGVRDIQRRNALMIPR
jgi:MFS family permease